MKSTVMSQSIDELLDEVDCVIAQCLRSVNDLTQRFVPQSENLSEKIADEKPHRSSSQSSPTP